MIGTRWILFDMNGADLPLLRVRVCAVETTSVLVEFEGRTDRWGGPDRRWLPRELFEPCGYSNAFQVENADRLAS